VPAFDTLLCDVDDGVATVTLNRPDRLNAFDVVLTRELHGLWRDFRFDDDVRAVVLTGAGDRAFCTGIDRGDVIPQPSGPWMMDDPGLSLGPKSADLWKPVVAAVNGIACGGAFYLLGNYERMSAARAQQVGLVQEVVPAAGLLPRAQQLAREIAEGPPVAVQGTVRSVWLAKELARTQALRMADVFVGLGNDVDLIAEGQERFAAGNRVDWRLR
jgi:enoyl-CoA hydratase/carnithine racemase